MSPGTAWIDNLVSVFLEEFGGAEVPRVAVAPGRVNLIGEHTDYNDGWVLPMAIDRRIGLAFAPRDDRVLRVHSVVFDETRELSIDELAPPGGSDWISYVIGVAWAMSSSGLGVSGANLVVDGDVPLGSGLSSSSALVMATALAMCEISSIPWSPVEMALLGHRVEREWVIIDIVDNGVGIHPADLERIFEEFVQLKHKRVRRRQRGSGLGLAISQRIAEAHGGAIEVESTLDEGSVFSVRLPREHEEME